MFVVLIDGEMVSFIQSQADITSNFNIGIAGTEGVLQSVENKKNISFIGYDGNVVETKQVTRGQYVEELEASEVEGKVFLGWYDELGNIWNFETNKVLKDTKLFARYDYRSIEAMVLDENGMEIISGYKVRIGATVSEIEIPLVSSDNLEFDGWYNGNTKLNPTDVISENMNLICKFKVVQQEQPSENPSVEPSVEPISEPTSEPTSETSSIITPSENKSNETSDVIVDPEQPSKPKKGCRSDLSSDLSLLALEGLSTTISTFYQAAKFCDEFDYIFCHNESILYEFIEKNDPALFNEIKRLVKEGKWHIMGGWYIQPDCNGLCGESYVRQIEVGRNYFKEKFNVKPTVAVNFDSFGHSTGMPQILAKTGHVGYLFCRPMKYEQKFDMREFVWTSKDGSKIKAARAEDDMVYISRFGKAYEDINRKASYYKDLEYGVALWGVGNHGGVNSRKDLQDVTKMIKEVKDYKIVHSTPEDYFNDINPTFVYEGPVQPKIIGSYTSMNSLKGLNAELERKLFNTEKMISVAEISAGYKPDYTQLLKATKAMLKVQFHDALAGTVCPDAEKSTIELGKGALAILEEMETEAYLSIASHELQAKPEENPVFLFNFLPYGRKAICEAEVLLMDGLYSDTEEIYFEAYQNGKLLKSQRVKELGNINYDRKIRTAFYCDLKPLNISRVDLIVKKRPITTKPVLDGDYVFENSHIKVRINSKTGLLDSYIVDGKQLLSGGAFEPILSVSTENPWGHDLERTTSNKTPFKLSKCDLGLTRDLKQMKIIEDGDLFSKIQSIFELDNNVVILTYCIYKEEKYIDVKANVFFNAKDRAIEFKIPASFDGKHFGQVAYCTEYFIDVSYKCLFIADISQVSKFVISEFVITRPLFVI